VANLLKGKTIFITGATSGFGLACAKRFSKEGARIVATGRREDRLNKLKKSLGSNVHILTFDVRKQNEVKKAIASLPKAFSNIDVLINNAGLAAGIELVPDTHMPNWEQMIDTNIKGVLYCTDAILPLMVKRDKGHIVNIGSVAGNYPYPGGNVYGSTKAFIKQFSLNLRADLLGKNIKVTNIEPGMAETEFSLVRFKGDRTKADAVYKDVKPLTADNIAETILFCLSQPAHVNVNFMEVMPVMQAFAGFSVHRSTKKN
jgi:NADP-dependent 3-hydroxy acid dehydrogenase YdfG